MERLLENKNAIIYGAGGGIGSGVARTFAREGARVFLAGRTRATLEAVAADIASSGGQAEVAVVDAHDERAVEDHVRSVVSAAGSLDVSFNLVTRGDLQGVPLVDLAVDDLVRPVDEGLRTNAITARAAARHMVRQGGGVILHLTSGSSAANAPLMGGTGPADAAVETFMRYLAAETGPQGVRVVGIWTAGVVETLTRESLAGASGGDAPDPEAVVAAIAGMALLRRAPRLAEVAETAAYLASGRASGITSTIVNVTSGLVAT